MCVSSDASSERRHDQRFGVQGVERFEDRWQALRQDQVVVPHEIHERRGDHAESEVVAGGDRSDLVEHALLSRAAPCVDERLHSFDRCRRRAIENDDE